MITVISGTNRKNSACGKFAEKFAALLRAREQKAVRLLLLEEIPHDWIHPFMYKEGGQSPSLARLQDEYMLPAEKFVFVIPEYNGSFPGILKLFLDACSVRAYKPTFKGKKACIIGVATGRAGNIRGIDHLTGVLMHVGTLVMPAILPISRIKDLMDGDGQIADPATINDMDAYAQAFLDF
jgi:NAD(P)H-dependent FMN reductase